MASINKIVLKGTSRMSLHERFTKLKFDTGRASAAPAAPASSLVYQHTPIPVKSEDGGYIRSESSRGRQDREEYTPTPIRSSRSRPRARTPDQPRYSARRMRSLSPMERLRSRISPEPRRSRRDDPNPNLFSTNRVKKKSVYLRLGVRPHSSLADRMSSGIPVWNPQSRDSAWGGGRQLSRSQSSHSLNRWNSQGSLENSYNNIPRYQQNNRRFRGGRGGRRNFAYNRQGRWRYGQGWFGGQRRRGGGFRGGNNRGYNNKRGGGRGGGGGGAWTNRFQRQAPAKREDLDAELDAYMSNTRGVLDTQLDSYMTQAQS